ncbi:hypothetical protein M072_0081 [Bacteroides fragilis str. DS-208]|nr:hypothetical protein M072_0081 [Bacteroides fragilis str. DS-208]
MVIEVLLRVTLLCIVSNNSYTKVGNIWNIAKYAAIYFYKNLIINTLKIKGITY